MHNLVDMPITMRNEFSAQWKSNVMKRLGGAKLLLLDEISLVSPRLLSALEQRLRAVCDGEKTFGGLHIIALGDFFQLRVVSDLPLFEGAVQHAAGKVISLSEALNPRTEENNGIELFCGLRMVNLYTQHRSKDPNHKRLIKAIRDPNVMHPLKESDIEDIGELTAADTKQDCWRNAVFVCQTNAQRRLYNEFGVKNFAQRTNQPVLTWTCPNGGAASNLDSRERKCGGQSLYGLGYDVKGYFVRGMPLQITQNIAVSQGIANGASAVAVSLTARRKNSVLKQPIRLPPIEKLMPGQEYEIELPHSVNVVLKKDWEKAVRAHFNWGNEVVVDEQEFDPSVVKVPTNSLIALPLITVYPTTKRKGESRTIRWKGHPCTPGFAMTFHKAQGQTYGGNLIISANKSSTGSALTLAPVYVALSRVKYLKCLRFMPLDVGRAKELAQLSYPHNLKMWARNYTDGLVDLVVDGVLDVGGRTVKVVCGGGTGVGGRGGRTHSLEVYSSSRSPLSCAANPCTKLRLCSAAALANVLKVTFLDHDHASRSSDAPLAECGDGLWKPAGLSTEFYAKELAVMEELEQYNNFETARVLQLHLRRLCSSLCIRYCHDDKNRVLVERLLPTWKKARARADMMKMKWNTKENRTKPRPSPDVEKHIARHEWCPKCFLPSYNKFNGLSVGDHDRTKAKRGLRFKRRCGGEDVGSPPQTRLTAAVATQMRAWSGHSTPRKKRSANTAAGVADGDVSVIAGVVSTETPNTVLDRSGNGRGGGSHNAKRRKTTKTTKTNLGKRKRDPNDADTNSRHGRSASSSVVRVLALTDHA